MRPVDKWKVKQLVKKLAILKIYKPYSKAKVVLEDNLGTYCSYCEKPISDESMHVEHIKPKHKYKKLQYSWSNFLVSCQRCNGVDNKGIKDVIYKNMHYPHKNNTYLSIVYTNNGTALVNPKLTGVEKDKAQKLIELVGLHKTKGVPGHNEGDKRAERRKTIIDLAIRYKRDFDSPNTKLTAEFISDFAVSNGFWSIWMEIFKTDQRVCDQLVSKFKGTFNDCRTKDINKK
jgi:uncharacterized protein (TIGR02646 family)